jgi:hypothetical protein
LPGTQKCGTLAGVGKDNHKDTKLMGTTKKPRHQETLLDNHKDAKVQRTQKSWCPDVFVVPNLGGLVPLW